MDDHIFQGLVLSARGSNLSLLSLQEGRVERTWYATKYRAPLHRGAFISYQIGIQAVSGRHTIEQVELERSALELGRQDIYVLHALLELCHYFIPVGSEAQSAFYFLQKLFDNFQVISESGSKKRLVCTLLALIGFYPDDSEIFPLVISLSKHPIDNLMQETIDLKVEKLMNRWLDWCRQTHPQGIVFKALPLFIEK